MRAVDAAGAAGSVRTGCAAATVTAKSGSGTLAMKIIGSLMSVLERSAFAIVGVGLNSHDTSRRLATAVQRALAATVSLQKDMSIDSCLIDRHVARRLRLRTLVRHQGNRPALSRRGHPSLALRR